MKVAVTDIATVTMNPAIDLSTSVDRVEPVSKLRCHSLRRDAGGGGINVARVLRRLGTEVRAIYTAGGTIGQMLQELVEVENVESVALRIAEETREDFTVQEEQSGQQFRFVLAGPRVTEPEWRAFLDVIQSLDPFPKYLVASGSLPCGVPDDFYGRLAQLARDRQAKLVVDTSGSALEKALRQGIFMFKPNLNELTALTGRRIGSAGELSDVCRGIVESGQSEIVALTLGDQGALLTTHEGTWRSPALPLKVVSAVGAGDSFVGGMVWSLSRGDPLETAFRYGMAAGAAALLSPGTELCHPNDIHRLFGSIQIMDVR